MIMEKDKEINKSEQSHPSQKSAMQTMVGFKQTEIGLIPEDWEVKTIGEIAFVIAGGTPSTNNDKYWNGSINWFTPTEVGYSKYLFESKRKITQEGLNNSSAKILPIGSILITSRATIGELGILKKEACTNQGFQSLVVKEEVNQEYLYYLLLTRKNTLIKLAKGSTFLEISSHSLKSVPIPLPPKPEQTAIAKVLSDTDTLIEKLEQFIAKKRLIKQGAMQQLLKPQKSWEVKKLGEICGKITTGKLDANAMKPDGEYRFYTCAKDYFFIDKYAFDDEALLISGNGENVGYVHYYKGKFNAYQRTYVLTGFSLNVHYIKKYLDKFLASRIEVEVNAGNTPYIRMDTLTEMDIYFPTEESEQTRIAQILTDMDNEIEALERKLAKYKHLKQGMMQVLLTGKIRLVKPVKARHTLSHQHA